MHQTGNVNTTSELLSQLATFASLCGWVIDKQDTSTLYLHNSQGFWSMSVAASTLTIAANTGYNAAQAWNTQPGNHIADIKKAISTYTGATTAFDVTPPFVSYDFFGTEQYIHVVVQIESARYRHFGIGILNKEGDYIGGEYAYGTKVMRNYTTTPMYCAYPFNDYTHHNAGDARLYAGTVRAENIAGRTDSPWYLSGYRIQGKGVLGNGAAIFKKNELMHPDGLTIAASQSQLGNVISPVPISPIVYGVNGFYCRLGTVADMCVSTIRGITAGSIIDIFGEKWKVFPVAQFQAVTSVVTGQDNTYDAGYLYRIVE